MKKVLFSYNDDNHEPTYWFNGECLGADIMSILTDMFYYGMEETEPETEIETLELYIFDLPDAFSEEEIDIIHNYFSYFHTIEKDIWQEIINQNWAGLITLLKNK